MTLAKSTLLGAALLVGASLAASAQTYPYPPQPYYQPPQTPPSWSYDPYTSGQAPCPQGMPDEGRSCSQRMPPTYGQPSYWAK